MLDALLDGDHVVLGQLSDGLLAVHAGFVRCVQGDGNLLSRPVGSRHLRIWHRWCELRGYRARRDQRQEREETNHIKLEEPQSTVALARAALARC